MSTPAVAVSPDGKKFVAAWKDLREGRNDANVYWTLAPNAQFAHDSLVHSTVRGEQNHPAVTIDHTGVAWVAWEDSRDGSPQIWIRTSEGVEHPLSHPSEGRATFPALAAGRDFVAIAYETQPAGKNAIVFRICTPD